MYNSENGVAASIQVNMLMQKCCHHYGNTDIRCGKVDMESDVPLTN